MVKLCPVLQKKDMELEKYTVKEERQMPTPASWKASDMVMLDVTCGMLFSLQRHESLPFTSSESHCIRLPQLEADG